MNNADHKYIEALSQLKEKIKRARITAVVAVNQELLKIYWEIGATILEQQKEQGWGAKVIDRLSADLKIEFPDFKGASIRNLKYMCAFAEAYPNFIIMQPPVAQLEGGENHSIEFVQPQLAQIPWSHHIVVLSKVKDLNQRLFYLQKIRENGWSKNVLSVQIENNLFSREGKAITNFKEILPPLDSDLAQETFKSPYIFDFVTLGEAAKERDIERALVQHLKKFMLELGRGFAYVGNQYNLNVAEDDFFLDLLFYNFHLHCFVAFELKVGDFKPEYAGKLNFYINTIDSQIKGERDKPTIGILLCKTPNETVVKYSLKGITSPIGIAEYKLEQALPQQLKGEIPSIEELEAEIEREFEELKSPADRKFEQIKNLISNLKHEEIKEKKSEKKCKEILEKVLFPLKRSLEKSLEEIVKMFEQGVWTYQIDNHYKSTEDSVVEVLEDEKNIQNIKLQIRLSGFKKAGTQAFGLWVGLSINLDDYYYKIGKERFGQDVWYENVYHILPDAQKLKELEEKFKLMVYDEIERNLKMIKTK